MQLYKAFVATLRSKRFWLWEIGGAIIYAIPVAIRFATNSIIIPFLNFPGFWIDHFIPGNFAEKVLVNAFFPGGAGSVASEVFFNNYKNNPSKRKIKYLYRLYGAILQTTAWSIFQFWGYSLNVIGPYGSNIFESIFVFPINFVLAAFSIFTPDVIQFVKTIMQHLHHKIFSKN
ncbi:MAG: hypothetical protein QXU99_00585 [Candidatus Bathyarchaeia archaeon]